MKKKLAAALVALSSLGGLAYLNTAYCFGDCEPKKCSFDTDCGVGCQCYKSGSDLYGVCVKD